MICDGVSSVSRWRSRLPLARRYRIPAMTIVALAVGASSPALLGAQRFTCEEASAVLLSHDAALLALVTWACAALSLDTSAVAPTDPLLAKAAVLKLDYVVRAIEGLTALAVSALGSGTEGLSGCSGPSGCQGNGTPLRHAATATMTDWRGATRRSTASTRRTTRARGGFDANQKKTFGVAPGEGRCAARSSQHRAVLRVLARSPRCSASICPGEEERRLGGGPTVVPLQLIQHPLDPPHPPSPSVLDPSAETRNAVSPASQRSPSRPGTGARHPAARSAPRRT